MARDLAGDAACCSLAESHTWAERAVILMYPVMSGSDPRRTRNADSDGRPITESD